MITESELKKNVEKYMRELSEARKALDDFRSNKNTIVYKNMPVIVEGGKVYASYLDKEGLHYYPNGANSHTATSTYNTEDWQPDYDRPSLLNWRPVNETIPEHDNWLLKTNQGHIFSKNVGKKFIIDHYGFGIHECLPLYKDK